jgi:hypothetical protein
MSSPDRDEAREFLSSIGIFAPWYLRDSQLDIYELLVECQEPFVEASRRFGKTTSIAVFVHELLNKNPGWIWRWCAPDQKQARQIVKPIFSQIQNMTPKENRALWLTTDSHYRYPNGSLLYLVGVNQDKGESARGPAANGITLDEYGFWVEAEYIAKSILFPQLQNQAGQYFIKASTPPPSLDHIYYKEKEIAIRKNKFIQKLIWDNEALSEKELAKIIEEAGGVDSVTFRREYLCQEIGDPKKTILPEFTDENIVPDDYPRPKFFTAYVSIDSGADDNTACLFAYHDFEKDEVVIEDEHLVNGTTTKNIIDFCKTKELELWGTVKPYVRVYDGDKQLIYDVCNDYQYYVQLPDKADKISSINQLRIQLGARKVKVKEKCTNTIRQFRVGQWKDERHSDFTRSKELGHLDAIAAGIYLNRSIDRSVNPIPQNYGLNRETHFITQSPGRESQTANAFKAFGAKTRRFT